MKIIKIVSPKIIESTEQLTSVLERFKKQYSEEMDLAFKDLDQLFAIQGWYIYGGSSVQNVLIFLKLLSENKLFQAANRFMQVFETNLDEIETNLANRKHPLSE